MFWSALLVLGCIYATLNVVLVLLHLGPALSDFSSYHQAARAILEGRSPFTVPTHDYPPLLSFLLTPFALLPYPSARLAWFGTSHLLILLAAAWTARALGGRHGDILAVAVAWTAAGSVAITLREGQVNSLLLVLLCVTFWPPEGHAWLRAWTLGTAAALKIWPGILVLGDLVRGHPRRALRAVVVALILIAAPLALIAMLLQGGVSPRRTNYWMGTPAILNTSLPAVVLRVLDPPKKGRPLPVNWIAGHNTETLRLPPFQRVASVVVAALTLVAGVGLIWLAVRRAGKAVDPAAVDAALIGLALLAAPIAWTHYQLLQLPGAARLGRDLLDRRRWADLWGLALAFVAANWTEAIVRGPYFAHYGTTAGSISLVWLLSSLPMLASAALFALHLRWLFTTARGLSLG
jgi:Glycosyltransferase family 87